MSMSETVSVSLRDIAETSTAWPFEEAKKIIARLKRKQPLYLLRGLRREHLVGVT